MIFFNFMHLHRNILLLHHIERDQAPVSGFNTDIQVAEVEWIVLYGKSLFIEV